MKSLLRWYIAGVLMSMGFTTLPIQADQSQTIFVYLSRNVSSYSLHWITLPSDSNQQERSYAETLALSSVRAIVIPPKGDSLVYVSWGNNDIVILNLITGETYPIDTVTLFSTDGRFLPKAQLNWSPNGQQLAFMGKNASGQADLYVYNNISRQVTNLTLGLSENMLFYPVWSPDGTKIAFLAYIQDLTAYQTFVVDTQTTALTPLVPNEPACALHWSPNGDYLASLLSCNNYYGVIDRNSAQIQLFSLRDNTATRLLEYNPDPDAPQTNLLSLNWASDDTLVTFQNITTFYPLEILPDNAIITGQVVAVDINTSQSEVIKSLTPLVDSSVDVFPRLDWILFHQNTSNHNYAYQPSTDTLLDLSGLYNCSSQSVTLSQDGQYLSIPSGCDVEATLPVMRVYDFQVRRNIWTIATTPDVSLIPQGFIQINP